ncbi:hypothetical protein AGLY_001837, partial [Aphis glycines]
MTTYIMKECAWYDIKSNSLRSTSGILSINPKKFELSNFQDFVVKSKNASKNIAGKTCSIIQVVNLIVGRHIISSNGYCSRVFIPKSSSCLFDTDFDTDALLYINGHVIGNYRFVAVCYSYDPFTACHHKSNRSIEIIDPSFDRSYKFITPVHKIKVSNKSNTIICILRVLTNRWSEYYYRQLHNFTCSSYIHNCRISYRFIKTDTGSNVEHDRNIFYQKT